MTTPDIAGLCERLREQIADLAGESAAMTGKFEPKDWCVDVAVPNVTALLDTLERQAAMLAASRQGEGSSADADTYRAAEGVVLDASQIKAVEHAAMDAGAHSWRRARLAMVEDGQIIGYPVFSRADMAELARLYRVTEGVKP